nr:hypothetical protein [Ameyamaea chiangmaiensis]
MVVERPSLRVLVFGWLGLVFHGAWMPGLLAGAATVALHLLPASGVVVGALAAGLHLGLSAFTPDIRRWDLRLRGYRAQKVVAGPDRDTALLRLLDRHPPTLNGDATVMGAA